MYLGGNRRWVPLFVAGKLPQSSFAIPSFDETNLQVKYLQKKLDSSQKPSVKP